MAPTYVVDGVGDSETDSGVLGVFHVDGDVDRDGGIERRVDAGAGERNKD
jgi:hypothetical protein